ncbi:MAG: radical SAM protein [Selenomonas ruminantium]|nr:radical SAM protein [Selenomonas ruminantium]
MRVNLFDIRIMVLFMHKVILNQDFKRVNESELATALEGKKLCVFGDSRNNEWIYEFGFWDKVQCIMDNDRNKWGNEKNNISIINPCYVDNSVVITVLADRVNVIPQIRCLGYNEFYFVCTQSEYEDFFKLEEKFYSEAESDFVWRNREIKYIHIIPDQKFVKPLVYILEKGFSMEEHAFLIYSFNRGNRKDEYRVWSTYARLQEKYGNIEILDGIFSLDENVNKRLLILGDCLKKCKRIIFHGEWLSDYVFGILIKYIDMIKDKGILIPWSGRFGYNECNKRYIAELLRFCDTICMDNNNDYVRTLIEKMDLKAQRYFYNGLNYSQPIGLPTKEKNTIPKVLVSHSCYSYNRIPEALSIISKFAGSIEVYCIASYGEDEVVRNVREIGFRLFGEKFHMVEKYMECEEYMMFISKMDIVVYGMEIGGGNTTLQMLCYAGAKLFFKPGTLTYESAASQGYHVYDYYSIAQLDISSFLLNEYITDNYMLSKKNFMLEDKVQQWKELFELPPHPKSYRIMIETTNICNAKCIFCANPTLKRQKKIMDSKIFDKILKRIIDENIRVERFILHLNGEPFTDPNLIDRIKVLKEKFPHVPVWFTTNFSLPTIQQIDSLIESGLDSITISLNTVNEDDYFKIMGGLSFKKTISNIEYLINKNKHKEKPIHVRLSIVDTGDEEKVTNFKRMFGESAEIRVIKIGKWMDSSQSLAPQLYGNDTGICMDLVEQICILSNGEYALCCFDAEGHVGLNVKDTPMLEAFHSSAYEKLRDLIRNGRHGTMCEKCAFSY